MYGSITQETVNEIVLKALKSGINYIDTAPWYGQGTSEERLGIALKEIPRNKYFIATKVRFNIPNFLLYYNSGEKYCPFCLTEFF